VLLSKGVVFCGGLGKSADLKLSDKGNQLYLDVERFLYMEISTVNFIQSASPNQEQLRKMQL
jgi:pyoverdine/dityrosine biosynthesis protein Dit1